MAIQALIITRDQHVFSLLVPVLQGQGMKVEGCFNPGETLRKLQKNKFDAVFIDCGSTPDALDLLEALRHGKSNRRAIAFAITDDPHDSGRAFAAGANFIIEKPVTPDRVERSLRAAHGLIVRERRRYFRHPVDAVVTIELPDGKAMKWNALDVSEGGMGMLAPETNEVSGTVRVQVRLPQAIDLIEGKAEIRWCRTGKVGVQFTTLRPSSRVELDRWTAKRFVEAEGRGFGNASR